jgi:hyaluronoglucosaminidase
MTSIFFLAFVSTSTSTSTHITNTNFQIAWNSPWPSHCPASYDPPHDIISRFGVDINLNNSFNGGVVTTLYNNPSRMTVGLWPCYTENGTAINGGLPQLANLTQHLDQVKLDIAAQLPAGFDGWAVIDWEVWVPWLSLSYPLYYNKSVALAGGDVKAATAAWNASSLEFMVQTLIVAQAVRPKAKLGYYGLV